MLETGAKNVYQDLNISLAVQAGQSNESVSSSAIQMEAYLQEKVDALKNCSRRSFPRSKRSWE
ncbi:hypothetical protein [Paenibacillus farraposensis]|uniref:hypothetical protein n=1 Tax=Paenibacillus farraposensis TaxID=2807095 RepID=UPI001E2ACA39